MTFQGKFLRLSQPKTQTDNLQSKKEKDKKISNFKKNIGKLFPINSLKEKKESKNSNIPNAQLEKNLEKIKNSINRTKYQENKLTIEYRLQELKHYLEIAQKLEDPYEITKNTIQIKNLFIYFNGIFK